MELEKLEKGSGIDKTSALCKQNIRRVQMQKPLNAIFIKLVYLSSVISQDN